MTFPKDNAFSKATHAKEDSIKGIFVPQHAEDGHPKETSFEPIDISYMPFINILLILISMKPVSSAYNKK